MSQTVQIQLWKSVFEMSRSLLLELGVVFLESASTHPKNKHIGCRLGALGGRLNVRDRQPAITPPLWEIC
jgi:hypothetical protein